MTQGVTVARPTLLMCADWFAPGSRAGGPIRSCVNLVELLNEDVSIKVLTGDRDLGANAQYSGVRAGAWNNWNGKAAIWYASRKQHYSGAFLRTVKRVRPDTIYLNSMFSPCGCVLPLMTQFIHSNAQIIVAPRGMLKPSAMQTRRTKKRIWLTFLKWSGLNRRVIFHATSNVEAEEIRSSLGAKAKVVVIPNAPCVPPPTFVPINKKKDHLKLTFVGRIHPIKNLLFVLRLLRNIRFTCSLNVIGPSESPAYLSECQQEIADLPDNISVNFAGPVSNEEAISMVSSSHVMILPTLGENFGHSIYESLAVGVPVLISDQTPWRSLEVDRAGWDCDLNEPERFLSILNQVGAMAQAEYLCWQQGAHRRAIRFQEEHNLREAYTKLLGGRQGLRE